MSITKSGQRWVSTSAQDIHEYLEAYSAKAYPVSQFRGAKCECGSDTFRLLADETEGGVQRTCMACGKSHFVCDSEEYWNSASPERWTCGECNSTEMNVGVGFSLYEDGEIRWLYVGQRCTKCGLLDCVADWKVGYSPSLQLFNQV
jgi:ribosomal protein S27AE